jgi:hypothetical protein
MTPNNISEAFAESVKEAIDGTVDMLLSTVEEIGGVRVLSYHAAWSRLTPAVLSQPQWGCGYTNDNYRSASRKSAA